MKMVRFIFLMTFFSGFFNSFAGDNTVNPVIGDLSFISKFGFLPNEKTDEILRIQTHLEFVELLLRKHDVSHLPKALQENRKRMLDLLHSYWNDGEFPANYDYPGIRIPCFIDKENRICAVGYLIKQTAGREVAEKINSKFKYEELLNMHDPVIETWIASSGLTKLECAMIQPGYDWRNENEYNPNLSVIYVPSGPTKKEKELTAKLDSQLVITAQLENEVDSLNSQLKTTTHKVDSLVVENHEKENEMDQMADAHQKKTGSLTLVIWTLAASLGTGTVVGLVKWIKLTKALKLLK